MEGASKIVPDMHMNFAEYVLSDSNKSAKIVKHLKKKYRSKIEAVDVNSVDDFGDTITGSMSILNVFIYTISILFAFVVIIIVCGKIFLKERTDYGIYKALGFTSKTLRLQFALRFALVAFIGSLFGIGLNICLNNTMMNALLYNVGITSFAADYNLASILLPILVLTVCFFVFAYFASRKIKKVSTKNLISSN
jgi:ABC-type antimicrobial peptide transport system permease subunit